MEPVRKHMTKGIRNILPNRSKDSSRPAPDNAEGTVVHAAVAVARTETARRGKERKEDRNASRSDITEGVSIFEVKPFHLGMFQGDELAAVQFRFAEFFSAIDVPMRI